MDSFEIFQQAAELINPKEIERHVSYIFWSLIVLNLIAFALVRSRNPTYFKTIFTTAIFNRQLIQNTQEHIKLFDLGGVLLTLAYFNCFAILASDLISFNSDWITIVVLGIICAAILIKFIIIKIISYLAKTTDGTHEHILNHLVFFQLAAIVITPALIFTHFLPTEISEIVHLCLMGIILLLVFIREIQSFVRAIRIRVSFLYIILYLCTLELLPLILIIKLFVSSDQVPN